VELGGSDLDDFREFYRSFGGILEGKMLIAISKNIGIALFTIILVGRRVMKRMTFC
jgi:hypothetical protein